jgi:4-hydroxy-3-polyprenylbenzoate decarboxylase
MIGHVAERPSRRFVTPWNSRAVIDACRPFEMLKDFPLVARATPELRRKLEDKFKDLLTRL